MCQAPDNWVTEAQNTTETTTAWTECVTGIKYRRGNTEQGSQFQIQHTKKKKNHNCFSEWRQKSNSKEDGDKSSMNNTATREPRTIKSNHPHQNSPLTDREWKKDRCPLKVQ